jgi:ketosteroid isomerase-like protein
MTESDVVRVALRFVNEINRHDVDALLRMVSSDHVFVDSRGQELRGPEKLAAAWTAYFAMFPDYRVVIDDHFGEGPVVGLFGTASATCRGPDGAMPPENRWKIPVSWKAVVRDGRIERWQVYADLEPVMRILAAAQR